MRDMRAIVVVDNNWGIGNDGRLLAHLPGDLAQFKKATLHKIVVMGRKTLESLPGGKPLRGRDNYVLSHDPDYLEKHRKDMSEYFEGERGEHPQIVLSQSIDELQWKLREDTKRRNAPKTVYIIGGASVYRQMLDYTSKCFVTKIEASFVADTFFPNLDADPHFQLAYTSKMHEENGYCYRFMEYRRIKAQHNNEGKQEEFTII